MKSGYGKKTSPNGEEWYEGHFLNDSYHGFGRQKKGQLLFEGYFKKDIRFGTGKTTYPNGTILEGNYEDDKKHGLFTSTDPSGNVVTREFDYGAALPALPDIPILIPQNSIT